MPNWIPKYIPKVHEKRAGEKVHNVDWNDSFNTLVSQGNWNTETLEDILTLGNTPAIRSKTSDNSLKLGGHNPIYFSSREVVIGTDEHTYRPNSEWMPTEASHPANKRYADNIQIYAEELFDTYKAKYATGVTILNNYASYEQMIAAHPRGKSGDAYLAAGRIYTWLAAENRWFDAGNMQGDKGDKGETGDGLPEGGEQGQLVFKESDKPFDYKYTDYFYDEVVTSQTTSKITVSGTAPIAPKNGDLWVKF